MDEWTKEKGKMLVVFRDALLLVFSAGSGSNGGKRVV